MQWGSTSQGSHWSLLVYDSVQRKFFYYDSHQGSNRRAAMRLAHKLSAVLPSPDKKESKKLKKSEGQSVVVVKSTPPVLVEVQCPQQTNGYDCGLYLLCVAKELALAHASGLKIGKCWEHLKKQVSPKSTAAMRDQIPAWIASVASEKKTR
mmetsp:Transcript_29966/g.52595  ORF Transcript_29966/g.52595 Transcript_29966/m.52595 type:complete len:151 (+) Transcript_29966:334-786(+)